jgi:hypothetical protein
MGKGVGYTQWAFGRFGFLVHTKFIRSIRNHYHESCARKRHTIECLLHGGGRFG